MHSASVMMPMNGWKFVSLTTRCQLLFFSPLLFVTDDSPESVHGFIFFFLRREDNCPNNFQTALVTNFFCCSQNNPRIINLKYKNTPFKSVKTLYYTGWYLSKVVWMPLYVDFWISMNAFILRLPSSRYRCCQLRIECLFLDAVCPVTHQAMQRN